ncbi:Outer-membrane receptor for Fe(III)-coprogen, Fe(III)-ferrioxamine B and Fe(III)-rhodotrulic acid [Pantoea agglomerans]|uniref:Outer-membrane receptor for Fe(III)-coprogen, Fe(III)-ferrioxamine B and Fe(III)-rhodotrulic acid n=1 Tax=Enterobacter agglomerans TaxID=549 RepID=A0A379ADY5_ENTAG|nr:Outer-membrane receptor for Fe(III)-coprogen, Fe(III)-ferrioxamine B and Fe(III)-rhodotrulic acid [Pantoea agglomerans]
MTGKSYETGLKSAWNDGLLTASVAIFRIEQDNVGQAIDGVYLSGNEQAYDAAKGAVSKGAEFELNGALTDNLQLTFGATRYVARDKSGRFQQLSAANLIQAFHPLSVSRDPRALRWGAELTGRTGCLKM